MSNLDNELGIPPQASLNPTAGPSSSSSLADSSTTATHATLHCPPSDPIPISITASIRDKKQPVLPRCIVIGRQASSADIRIDHGSISRRHAALYYDTSTSTGASPARLMLQDLGGKHGTYVNGQRMAKKTTVQLNDGDALVFGNVKERKFVIRLGRPPAALTISRDAAGAAADDTGAVGATSTDASAENNADIAEGEEANKEDDTTKPDPFEGLSGRERREAEIAAMMASLDDNPAYKKYSAPPPAEGAEDGIARPTNGVGAAAALDADTTIGSKSQSQLATSTATSNANEHGLPVTRTAPFTSSASAIATPSDPRPGGGRSISALSLDPSGSRFVTGCTDTNIRLYDFNGMDANQNAFREVTVEEGHPIVAMCHSNTGDRMIVGTTSAQPMVLDRDGREIIQFAKGDVYVTDMSRTIGHTAAVTDVAWHPLERDVVLTASIDGSARLWNLASGKTAFKKLKCDNVYRTKNARGIRTGVTACSFHPSGRELCLGTADGSIQIWDATKVKSRPDRVLYDAHGTGKPVSFIAYNFDGKRIATRSSDDTAVNVWEARKISRSAKPLLVAGGLPSLFDGSNCAFSPDGKVLVAGTSVEPPRKGQIAVDRARGTIRFYPVPSDASGDPSSREPILELDAAAPGASIVKVAWHPKLNQIFVGASDGSCRVFYDDKLSNKGALVSMSKGVRRKDDLSLLLESRAPQGSIGIGASQIIAPHALPMYRDEKLSAGKRKREELKDPIKSKRPQAPEGGVKTGGQTSASVNFTQFVVKSTIKNKNIAGKDPREELFKYSEGKTFSSKAYEGDRERVLTSKTAEQEEEEMKSKKK